MKPQIERLSELNQRTGGADGRGRGGGAGTGRYGRRPDYTAPAVSGTRPRSDRGVTFHFKHSYVSKRNSVSTGYRDQTSAPAHQSYIERPGAAEMLPDDTGEPRPVSFGTLGETKAERTEFWRKVERAEGRSARVQCRMIVELPHELGPAERAHLARDFCQVLADEGFPYHCVVHAPDAKNDRRNTHMHIAYFDRPATRGDDGTWDFERVEEVRGKNRSKRLRRPDKQPKRRHTQGAPWIRQLRRTYADVANAHLALNEVAKRYDARSYADSGVAKTPTLHMGTRRAHAESQGLDTRAGVTNAKRELSYRLSSEETRYIGSAARMSARARWFSEEGRQDPGVADLAAQGRDLCAQHEQLSREAVQVCRRRVTHDIAGELVGARLARRIDFLGSEAERLTVAPPKLREGDALKAAATLYEEYDAAREARRDLAPFVLDCQRVASTQQRRLAGIQREQGTLEQQIGSLERAVLERRRRRRYGYAIDDLLEANELAFELASDPQSPRPEPTPTAGREPDERVDPARLPQVEQDTPERSPRTGDAYPEPTQENAPGLPGLFTTDSPSVIGPPGPDRPHTGRAVTPDPYALRLSPDAAPEQIVAFDRRLLELSNRDLRRSAFATRDSADLASSDAERRAHATALAAIRTHAAKRGLDLDSGVHRPDRARDPDLARHHTDSAAPNANPRWWDPYTRVR